MEATRFERAVLEWIARQEDDPALASQLLGVAITERDYTGAGCYIALRPAAGASRTGTSRAPGGPCRGPAFTSPAVELGGGTLLWLRDGLVEQLEVFSYGDGFPEDLSAISEFSLCAGDTSRGSA